MNNIELNQLKKDLKEFLGYTDDQVEKLGVLTDVKLNAMRRDIQKIKNKRMESNTDKYTRNLIEKRINEIFKRNPHLKGKEIIGRIIPELEEKTQPNINNPNKPYYIVQQKSKKIKFDINRKPRILFISDVKGWAWWIKSHYIKKYLSDEFDIDVTYVLGDGCTPTAKIDQGYYDLYFTYGFSYIDFLTKVPKHKKVTGITAHRAKHVIFPKMQMAGHVHANSMMLLKELYDMGFRYSHYIPNGVNEKLFRPIDSIKKDGSLVVGHVGKECEAKGQREFIIPSIQAANVNSYTNLRNWKDKISHDEMPNIYNQMDVFVVASTEDGTPNPALEAAACGRPIISNRIGNMPEFIEDGYNGFIVPRKVEAYVEKIKYFKENRDELIRMGKNARKTVLEGWTWKLQSENYRKMFREIFNR